MLRMTALATTAGAVPSATAKPPWKDDSADDGRLTVRGRVSDGVSRDERCRVPDGDLERLGLAPGRQARLRFDGTCALFTVERTSGSDVEISPGGAARLGLTKKRFTGDLDVQVVHPTMSEEEAAETGEFVERAAGGGDAIALAPHGGYVEYGTDDQAVRFADALDATRWYCAGWSPGGGAFDRWHITSTAIHPDSFPELAALDSTYGRAVAFHGWSGDGIAVGGGASRSVRERVRDAIRDALDGAVAVELAPDDGYDGDSPENVVNWLDAESAGIQLEQSWTARTDYGVAVADAVADAVASL